LHIGHVAETHEKAWDECEAHLQWHLKVHFKAMAAPENQIMIRGQDLTVPPLEELRKTARGPYGPAYVGTPDEVIKMLEEELKICPMTQMVFSMDSPGMDPRYMRSSLELLAKEVIPHFRNHRKEQLRLTTTEKNCRHSSGRPDAYQESTPRFDEKP
jgi:alkanesulfonate monooxygenase SsuD/methylene tetrahydromethanopterin reductase-like flavin-dependent oxidoreductase (luciferase family)